MRDDIHFCEHLVDKRRTTNRGIQLVVSALALVQSFVRDQHHVHIDGTQATNESEKLLVHHNVVGFAIGATGCRVNKVVVNVGHRIEHDRPNFKPLR